jgi:serine protease
MSSMQFVRAAAFVAALSLNSLAVAQTADGPPQRVIVKWRAQIGVATRPMAARQAISNAEARFGVTTASVRTIATGAEVLRLGQRVTPAELRAFIATVAANPAVEYAEEDRLLQAVLTPNDARFNEQWHYFETTAGVNAPLAWDIVTGAGVTVGVIDTGYRPHADLAANIVGGYDFISDAAIANDGDGRDADAQDPGDWTEAGQCDAAASARNSSWHGTHVAGTIAALTNDTSGNGVAGVAFGARVLPLRVLGRCGGFTSDIADAIIWGSGGSVSGVPENPNPARVLNLSLGGADVCAATTQTAIDSARSRGAVVIVAAGNSNLDAMSFTPANCSGVITVAAVGRDGGKAPYSNFGVVVDLAAPGGSFSTGQTDGILSTLNTGTTTPDADSFAFYQGTSMASPHAAGVAALMLSRNGALTPDDLERRMRNSARAFPATCTDCGAGIVDALAAVNAAAEAGGDTVLQNGVAVENLSGAVNDEMRFTIEAPAGASNLQIQISGGTGDADLYVRFGAAPTTSVFDCRPYLDDANEICTISAPQAGTYHIMLHGFTVFSGVTLRGSFQAGN